LLHLLQEQHAASPKEGGQGLGYGDERGDGGEPRAEATEGVEDEHAVRDGGVVLGEGVGEVLLAAAVLGDGGGALEELPKLVVEVDRLVGLVGREEIA
jgi:hypothetical protein